ncbi:MAG: hypothetical protein KUG65_07570 [Sphingomonadaceae bacterium]|nr:hypothetical protein [Sphingomonadaceae bacterium]
MTMNEGGTPDETAGRENNVVRLPGQAEPPQPRKIADFVHEHPVMCIAGGLAVGAVAAALIPRRNREIVANRTSLWGKAVAAAGAAITQQALSQVNSATTSLRDSAESMATRAEHAGHATMDRMERVGETSLSKARVLLGREQPEPPLGKKIAEKAVQFMTRPHR